MDAKAAASDGWMVRRERRGLEEEGMFVLRWDISVAMMS